MRTGNTYTADHGFTGHYFHAKSGYDLTQYRLYDPQMGRWLSREPLGEFENLNLYRYGFNNPIMGYDPNGLWFVESLQWGLDFTRGAADAGTFGLTRMAREYFHGENGCVVYENAYLAGELAETVAEIALTGGLAIGKAASKKFAKELIEQYGEAGAKNFIKNARKRGVNRARSELNKKGKRHKHEGKQGHHVNPVKEGKFARLHQADNPKNIRFLNGDAAVKGTAHNIQHKILSAMETADNVRDYTMLTRQAANAYNVHGNPDDDCP